MHYESGVVTLAEIYLVSTSRWLFTVECSVNSTDSCCPKGTPQALFTSDFGLLAFLAMTISRRFTETELA